MNYAEKISELLERCGKDVEVLKRGLFFVRHKGWLHIEDRGGYWSVLWTNLKGGVHGIFLFSGPSGPAIQANFRGDNGERRIREDDFGAWKVAFPNEQNEKKAVEIFKTLTTKIDMAYRFHILNERE